MTVELYSRISRQSHTMCLNYYLQFLLINQQLIIEFDGFLLLHHLTDNFVCNLIAPFINNRHVNVIDECSHFSTAWWAISCTQQAFKTSFSMTRYFPINWKNPLNGIFTMFCEIKRTWDVCLQGNLSNQLKGEIFLWDSSIL